MKNSSVIDHKCINCGAVLKFSPHTQTWDCEYCKSVFTKEQIEENEKKRGIEELTQDSEPNKVENVSGMDEYICPNCGAQIIADENTSATFCIYCKNTAIIRNKLIGEFNPSKIIPFYKTKEDAINKFLGLTKGKPLAPRCFTSKKNIAEIRGVYVPFWLFDYELKGSIKMLGTKVTQNYIDDATYVKTDTYSIHKEANVSFDKIPVDGSMRLDNTIMNAIEPYFYDKLQNFNHSYLSGFYAEKYDVDSNTAEYDALKRVYTSTTNIMKRENENYYSLNVISTNHAHTRTNCEYVLLPVWLLNIKYNNKLYTFAMNGQTGKIAGDIPLDKKRAVIYSITIFVSFLLILSLFWFLFVKLA